MMDNCRARGACAKHLPNLPQTRMAVCEKSRKKEMQEYPECGWVEFENRIGGTIESEMSRRAPQMDSLEKRSMIGDVILHELNTN